MEALFQLITMLFGINKMCEILQWAMNEVHCSVQIHFALVNIGDIVVTSGNQKTILGILYNDGPKTR